jgi:2-polyprenyl-3-methyl-5-hydroxy-6-metoxy-1,4-benzoquinol methylase
VTQSVVLPLLEQPGPCPVCGGADLRPLHVYEAGSKAEWYAVRVALVGCAGCGVGFSHPLPSEAQLDAYYRSEAEGWDGRVAADVAEDVLARKFEDKRARHRAELAHLARLLGPAPPPGRSALDYGCGVGAFLDVLAEEGWRTAGVEPGETARAIAGERHAVLDELPAAPAFSFAVAYHVLEHLRRPLDEVSRIAAALEPSGHLLVAVPDAGGLGSHHRFTHVFKFPHMFMFTRASLAALLALAGFEVVATSQDGEEWPETKPYELKCLARRAAAPVPLPPDPLAPLLDALRAYGDFELAERRRLREQAARGRVRRRLRRALGRAGPPARPPKF